MPKNKNIVIIEGQVLETLPSLQFRVELKSQNREILAYLAGKMKKYRIRVVAGDRVKIEMPNETSERGRITRRL
jgi:translation initiation factor IF-1